MQNYDLANVTEYRTSAIYQTTLKTHYVNILIITPDLATDASLGTLKASAKHYSHVVLYRETIAEPNATNTGYAMQSRTADITEYLLTSNYGKQRLAAYIAANNDTHIPPSAFRDLLIDCVRDMAQHNLYTPEFVHIAAARSEREDFDYTPLQNDLPELYERMQPQNRKLYDPENLLEPSTTVPGSVKKLSGPRPRNAAELADHPVVQEIKALAEKAGARVRFASIDDLAEIMKQATPPPPQENTPKPLPANPDPLGALMKQYPKPQLKALVKRLGTEKLIQKYGKEQVDELLNYLNQPNVKKAKGAQKGSSEASDSAA